jgi:hypothetical protein
MKLRNAFVKRKIFFSAIVLLLLIKTAFPQLPQAQTSGDVSKSFPAVSTSQKDGAGKTTKQEFDFLRDFRVEKIRIQGSGAEIITIFINLRGVKNSTAGETEEVPLFSVL